MAAPTATTQVGYHQPTTLEEVRTLWIGDLQYWVDETYLSSCFAHTGEVLLFLLFSPFNLYQIIYAFLLLTCMYGCLCVYYYFLFQIISVSAAWCLIFQRSFVVCKRRLLGYCCCCLLHIFEGTMSSHLCREALSFFKITLRDRKFSFNFVKQKEVLVFTR